MTINAYSQTYRPDSKDSETFLEKIYVGAYVNSPFIGGNTNASVFALGLQPFAGYKWNEYISTGLTISYDYTYVWIPSSSSTTNPNYSLSDISATTFARATIAQRFMFQIEGGYYSLQRRTTSFGKERINFPVAYVGAGYTNRFYEFLITYELLGNLAFNTGQIPFNYKIGFVKHF
jgi:hypothetical protein